MFGWFRPTCPCDPSAKQWVEDRLRWLVKQFGLHIILERPIVLPTPEFFPDPWDGTEQAARKMFRRVCKYMGVPADAVGLRFFNDQTTPTDRALGQDTFAAGTWSSVRPSWASDESEFDIGLPAGEGTISIERGSLDRPADLVGTLAHELSHQRLLGEKRFSADCFDNELLTDLTAIFHGFGIFIANDPRKSTGKLSKWPGTDLHMPEYLSEPMIGYALAHVAWLRDEPKPAWAGHLRWTPRGVFKQGLRFLQETGDSGFKPVRLVDGTRE